MAKLLISLGLALLLSGCTGARLVRTIVHKSPVNVAAFTSAGDAIATGGRTGKVALFTVRDGVLQTDLGAHAGPVISIDASILGDVATVSADEARLWSTRTGSFQSVRGDGVIVRAVAFSSRGDLAAIGTNHGVSIHVVATGARVRVLPGWSEWVYSLAFSPRGDVVAGGCGDGVIRIWSIRDGTLLHKLTGAEAAIYGVDVSPSGELVAGASLDGTVRLWKIAGNPVRVLREHADGALCVAFDADGERLVSGGRDGLAKVWHVRDGTLLKTLKHGGEVMSVSASRRGDLWATAGGDGIVRLWAAKD
jgi:WD40 repeat protein